MKIIITLIFSIFLWNQESRASRNCNLECPIMQDFFQRKNCVARCEQANSQEREVREQTELLETQIEKQEELEQKLEEQEDLINELKRQQMQNAN